MNIGKISSILQYTMSKLGIFVNGFTLAIAITIKFPCIPLIFAILIIFAIAFIASSIFWYSGLISKEYDYNSKLLNIKKE